MNSYNSGGRPASRWFSPLRPGLALAAFVFVGLVHVQAQIVVSQSDAGSAYVDGFAHSVYFDFSSFGLTSGVQISKTTLTIDFGKFADLDDDPPGYSEIGLVLNRLDESFLPIDTVTLIEFGSFNDGATGSWFDGTITFDDDALTYVNSDPDNLLSGIFKPVEPLSLFNGEFSSYWELRIVDGRSQDPLYYRGSTLSFVAVPEPATYGLIGAALLALIAVRSRLRRNQA